MEWVHTMSLDAAAVTSQVREEAIQTPIFRHTKRLCTLRTAFPTVSLANHITSPLLANHLIKVHRTKSFLPKDMRSALWYDQVSSLDTCHEPKTYRDLAFLVLFLCRRLGGNIYGFHHGCLHLFVVPVPIWIQCKLETFFRCPGIAQGPGSSALLW
jgi:hypothetical protein